MCVCNKTKQHRRCVSRFWLLCLLWSSSQLQRVRLFRCLYFSYLTAILFCGRIVPEVEVLNSEILIIIQKICSSHISTLLGAQCAKPDTPGQAPSQSGSLCGCVCDRMADIGEKNDGCSQFLFKKVWKCICEVLIGVCRWKHWSFGFMKQLFNNNVKEFFSDWVSYFCLVNHVLDNSMLFTILLPMYFTFPIFTPFPLKLTTGFPCSANVVIEPGRFRL